MFNFYQLLKTIEHTSSSFISASVVTIGTFDGVHIGHQKILEQLARTAKIEKLQSCVLTFFPHPRMVLQQDSNIKLINTIDERSQLLEKTGIDFLFVKEFDLEFSRLGAEDFVKTLLVETLKAKKIIDLVETVLPTSTI